MWDIIIVWVPVVAAAVAISLIKWLKATKARRAVKPNGFWIQSKGPPRKPPL